MHTHTHTHTHTHKQKIRLSVSTFSASLLFSPQSINIPFILLEPANTTCTQHGDPSRLPTVPIITVSILAVDFMPYNSPGMTLDIFSFPVAAQEFFFFCPTTPRDLVESIH